MTRLVLGVGLAFGISAALGCGSDEVTADDDGDDEAETGTETSDESMIGPPARGIDILEVEANQGTAVLIGQGGEWVGGEGRNAFMVRNRDTLIRLQHSVGADWTPREIIALLHIKGPDGVELEPRSHTLMIEASSDIRDLSTGFFFSVVAEEALPGTEYWVELRELGDGADVAGVSEGVNVTPPDFGQIGYEKTALEMKVMLVPIEYTHFTVPTLVEFTSNDLQLLEDQLLQQNPSQTVTLEVHEPYTYSNQITNLGQLLGSMSALRSNDGADPNVYYHAMVDVNGPSVSMVAGIAQLAGDGKAGANSRVAATVWFKPNPEVSPGQSASTFVHEVGHNQGLSHVYCPNAATEAAGPDPNYPHEGGKIGVYGFGIRDFRLHSPSGSHDYMTYCGNSWVSDWTWNKTYNRIETLTAWDYEGPSPGPEQVSLNVPLIWGALFPDGSEQWLVMQGPAPAPEQLGAEQPLRLLDADGVVEEVYTSVSTLSDGASTVILAPLTVPLAQLRQITRVDWRDDSHAVALDSIEVVGAP